MAWCTTIWVHFSWYSTTCVYFCILQTPASNIHWSLSSWKFKYHHPKLEVTFTWSPSKLEELFTVATQWCLGHGYLSRGFWVNVLFRVGCDLKCSTRVGQVFLVAPGAFPSLCQLLCVLHSEQMPLMHSDTHTHTHTCITPSSPLDLATVLLKHQAKHQIGEGASWCPFSAVNCVPTSFWLSVLYWIRPIFAGNCAKC